MRRMRADCGTQFDELPSGLWRRRLVAGDKSPIPHGQPWYEIEAEYGVLIDVHTRPGPQPQHDCPGGCRVQVPHHQYACKRCWGRLPSKLQVAITGTNRRDMAAHGDAMAAARRWFAEHPLSAAIRQNLIGQDQ